MFATGGRAVFASGCAGLLPQYLENACIGPHQTWSVGKGSDRLQLIKFCPPAPLEGGLRLGENFWPRLTTASTLCLRLSVRSAFFILLFVFSPNRITNYNDINGTKFLGPSFVLSYCLP